MKKAWDDVLAERQRQINEEGWHPAHDDAHRRGELAGAAACYAMHDLVDEIGLHWLAKMVRDVVRYLWPWAEGWWKPKDRRSNLVRAAALLIAEIERLDRAPQA